jgi:5-carboxymethyl-2-hydroxymuconic-semialdehyde dehydrogenase
MSDLSTHLVKLETHLARYRENGILNLIDGKDATATETFETRSPVDESLICSVARGTAADVNAAARAAKAAFPAWAATSGEARKKILHASPTSSSQRAEEIALCECWDTGQALSLHVQGGPARGGKLPLLRGPCPRRARRPVASHQPMMNVTTARRSARSVSSRPWNTPFMLSTWKIAPALAAGCTVVHKPAEFSPVTARILPEIAEEAGLPAGVWNLVNGFGEDAGKALTEHPDIKAIAFVGESRTGSMIMKQGADTLKRVHFELGGKNPVIVFDDADLDRALDAAIFMIYSLNGERCTSSSSLLVQERHRRRVRGQACRAGQQHQGRPPA